MEIKIYTPDGIETLSPICFLAATVFNRGEKILRVSVHKGKGINPRVIDCTNAPKGFSYISFNEKWEPSLFKGDKTYTYKESEEGPKWIEIIKENLPQTS